MEKLISLLIDLMEFLSFWMVAPEFLGEQRLKAIEKRVLKLEVHMPGLLFGLFGIFAGLFFAIAGAKLKSLTWWNYVVFAFLGFYLLGLILYMERMKKFLVVKVFGPFFRELSDSQIFRQKFLKAGIILFVTSFMFKVALFFCTEKFFERDCKE